MKSFSIGMMAALTLAASALTGCKKDQAVPANTGEFTLYMDNGVSTTSAGTTTFNKLTLGSASYKTPSGDDFTVSTFKYYISNVKLLKADNSTYSVPDSYFLVDHSNSASQSINMQGVPVGDYTGVSFVVGVDSTRTKAGNFTGVLNASNGMYWDMNGPEFINLKLEGASPQAPHAPTATTGGLIFHIAGYKHSTTNTIRTVTLPFGSTNLLVRTDHSPEVHMHVDIAKMFSGATAISFASTSNIMGGTTAARIADNVQAGMFTVSHIHAN